MTAEAQARPRVNRGAVALSRGKLRGELGLQCHLSTLALRWLLVVDLREAQATAARAGRVAPESLGESGLARITALVDRELSQNGDPMPRPRQRWVDVIRAVATAIATEEMREREPDEAAKFDAMKLELDAKVADAKRRGERARKAVDREAKQAIAVFLSRFFPVPAPNLLVPGFWTLPECRRIGQKLAGAIASLPTVAEPEWFPDGWRESMAVFGQGKVNNDG